MRAAGFRIIYTAALLLLNPLHTAVAQDGSLMQLGSFWDVLLSVADAQYPSNDMHSTLPSSSNVSSRYFYQSFGVAVNKVSSPSSTNVSVGELSLYGYEAMSCQQSLLSPASVAPFADSDYCVSCPQGTSISSNGSSCVNGWELLVSESNAAYTSNIHVSSAPSSASLSSSAFQSFGIAIGKVSAPASTSVSVGEITVYGYQVSPCPAGTVLVDGTDYCMPCPQGTYYYLSGNDGSTCANGWELLVSESDAGYTAATHVSSVPAASASAFQSFAVAIGKVSASASSSISIGEIKVYGYQVAVCSPGSFAVPGNADYCMQCPKGTYLAEGSAGISIASCIACPAGSYSSSFGSSSCTACAAGTYSSATSATSIATCVSCPAGLTTMVQLATSKAQCVLVPTFASLCLQCPPGTYGTVGQPPGNNNTFFTCICIPCPAGTYAATTGVAGSSEACMLCPPGKASAAGAVECIACCW